MLEIFVVHVVLFVAAIIYLIEINDTQKKSHLNLYIIVRLNIQGKGLSYCTILVIDTHD